MQVHPGVIQIIHVDHNAAAALAEIHQSAHILRGSIQVRVYKRLFLLDNAAGIGVVGGVFDGFHRAVGQRNAVFYAGGRGDQIQIELAFQTLGDDFQMQQAQKAAAEAKAQSHTGFRLEAQGGIVQLQFLQGVLQIGVFGTVYGVNAAEHHGRCFPVAGHRFGGGVGGQRDGIAHAGFTDILDAGGEVAHLTGTQLGAGGEGRCAHVAHFHQRKLGPGGHHAHGIAGLDGALEHADINDNALVTVVHTVEDQSLEGRVLIAHRGGNVLNHPLQNVLNADAHFGGDARGVQTGQTDYVLHFLCDPIRLRTGQIDFVQDGNDFQVVLHGQIGVGQRLGFHTLAGVHHQHGAFTGGQAAADFVTKVHMARGIDQIQLISFAVFCVIIQGNGTGLNGNAALPFQIHVVQQLIFHQTLVHGVGFLQDAIGQGGFAVVNVSNDAEISDVVACQVLFPPVARGLFARRGSLFRCRFRW